MLQFENNTPFEATMLAVPDPDGVDTLYAVVKGTFTIAGDRVAPAEEPLPIAMKDTFYGKPADSSLKTPGDLGLVKPGTDVLLTGTAKAPNGVPHTLMDVILNVGPIQKRVIVHGDRRWESGSMLEKITAPEPFTEMPLVWERAFGGSDASVKPEAPDAENRNPVGAGFRAVDSSLKIEDIRLPNIEDPSRPISKLDDRPAPAGFGPIAAHWEPRRGYAGTYDDAWETGRAPYLPEDFDPRFFQLAPPDQVSDGYLTGGEPVEITGVAADGPLTFALPAIQVRSTFVVDEDDEQELPMNLDTVHIMADERKLILTWRSAFPCDKKLLRVTRIAVSADGL